MIKTVDIKPTQKKDFSKYEFKLYFDYKNELRVMEGLPLLDRDTALSWYTDNINNLSCHLLRVFDDNTQVGFVFIAVNENCPEMFDYYIQDCYLSSKYRKQQIMWNLMYDFVGNHPGRYCYFVINKNTPAVNFWSKLFTKWLYHKWNGVKSQEIIDMESDEVSFVGYM